MTNEAVPKNIILLYESEVIFNRFRQVFGNRYQIFWGKDLNATMDALSNEEIGVMICDIHYHNQDIYPVVLALKQMHPELVTMIVTTSDNAQAIATLEAQDEIFAALIRPITQQKLNDTLDAAFAHYLSHRDEFIKDEAETDEATMAANLFSGMSLSEAIRSAQLPNDIKNLDLGLVDLAPIVEDTSEKETIKNSKSKDDQLFDSLFFDDMEYIDE